MQWSKLKKSVESYFADSVKGRVELRSTRYKRTHDNEGRGYITIDKEEVASFCSISTWNAKYKVESALREISGATDYRNPDQQEEYYAAYDQADDTLQKQGVYSQYGFYASLTEFISLPIEEAVISNNAIIQALAILDRRLGKRRIILQQEAYSRLPMLNKLFEFRCSAEGIRINLQHSKKIKRDC